MEAYFKTHPIPHTVAEFAQICIDNKLGGPEGVPWNGNEERVDTWTAVYNRIKGPLDVYNANAYNVLTTQGTEEFVKHVFTDQDNPSEKLSYAEMRMRYG